MALTEQKKRFVQEYVVDLNGSAAAVRAGYSAKSAKFKASKLLDQNDVQAYLQKLMAEKAKRCEIDADYVLNTIRDTVERCRQAEPVVDRKGNPVFVQTPGGEVAPAYVFDPQAVLKGAELLGKHLKIFTDKLVHQNPDGSPLGSKAAEVHFYIPGNGRD